MSLITGIPIFALFIIGATAPVSGVLLAMVCETWFSYVDISGFPPRNYVAAGMAVLWGVFVFTRYHKGMITRRMAGIYAGVFLFISWSFLVNSTQMDVGVAFYNMGSKQVMPVMLSLFIATWFISRKRVEIFVLASGLAIALSGFVGIMQFLGVESFWDIRFSLNSLGTATQNQLDLRARIPGLAYFAVPLSYQLGLIIPILIGFYGNAGVKIRMILRYMLLICFFALLMTLMRSAIMGILMGGVYLLYKKQSRFKYFKFIMGIFALAIGLLLVAPASERLQTLDDSAMGRLPLALAGLKITQSHPFGIGMGQYSEYAETMYDEFRDYQGAAFMLQTSSHNQFINTLVAYGIPGFLLLMVLYVQLFKTLSVLMRSSDRFLNSMGLGLSGALISYTVNSFFHNAGLYYGDVYIWYFVGLILALHKLELQHKREASIAS